MPFGRKHATKSGSGSKGGGPHGPSSEDTSRTKSGATAGSSAVNDDDGTSVPLPSHPDFPDLPSPQGELFFECTLFLYSVLALFLQYINIYKCMWWLPNYNCYYAVKFHLINPYLLSCIGLVLGRRVTWCFLKKLTIGAAFETEPPFYVKVVEWVFKSPMLGAVMTSFMFSLFQVVTLYPIRTLIYLIYPSFFYCLFFQRELAYILSAPTFKMSMKRMSDWVHSVAFNIDPTTRHACSVSPARIREEVNILHMDFWLKLRHGLFSALCSAYYAIFIPCCFAPTSLHVDYWWVGELCIVVFLTSLLLHMTHEFQVVYCDLLHRAAAHLGSWQKMENVRLPHAIHMPYQTWSENSLWPEGSVVKFGRSLYRGQGTTIAAEPGNFEHGRFYYLFSDPVYVLNALCVADGCLILIQFLMLVHSLEWQHVMTLVLLMFANYLMLFKLFKDKVILGRIYNPLAEDEEI